MPFKGLLRGASKTAMIACKWSFSRMNRSLMSLEVVQLCKLPIAYRAPVMNSHVLLEMVLSHKVLAAYFALITNNHMILEIAPFLKLLVVFEASMLTLS